MPILPCQRTDYDGSRKRTAELIGELAESVTESHLRVLHLIRDEIPDIRRSRRRTRTTKVEKILVLKKRADSSQADEREPVAVADAPKRRPAQRRGARRGLDER